MKKIDINIAIARWRGLEVVSDGITHDLSPCEHGGKFSPGGKFLRRVPNYQGDLNAIQEVVRSIPEKIDRIKYAEELTRILSRTLQFRSPGVTDFEKMTAKAHQCAEAFCRTFNLWRDSK